MFHPFKSIYNRYFNKGAYIKLTYNYDSMVNLYDYILNHNIPNNILINDIHTTLLYTKRQLDDYIPSNKLNGIKVTPIKFEVWKTYDGLNCLVLIIENKELNILHNHIIKKYNGKHIHDQFIPHITLSYSVGDKFDCNKLPLPDFDLIISNEIMFDLNKKYLDIRGLYVGIT